MGNPDSGTRTPDEAPAKKTRAKRWWGIALIVLAMGVLISVTGGCRDEPARDEDTADQPEEEAGAEAVTLTAATSEFKSTMLADHDDYTSVQVTIRNDSDDAEIETNPLHFHVVDDDGTKHSAVLGVEENQLATLTLRPDENVSGAITVEGTIEPAYVVYDWPDDPIRIDVE